MAAGCALPVSPEFQAGVGEVTVTLAEVPDAGAPDAGPPDAGTPDAGQPDAGMPACSAAAVDATAACAECQAADCCVTLGNCANDAQCSGLYACQRACTTNACLTGCRNQFPGGVWLVSGLIICSSAKCSAQCAMPARNCGGIGLTTASCNSCVQQQCCAESSACAANDSCDAFIYQCIDHQACNSTTNACGLACRETYDAGMPVFDALRGCALSKCATQCAGL